jgi:hypothetical protein
MVLHYGQLLEAHSVAASLGLEWSKFDVSKLYSLHENTSLDRIFDTFGCLDELPEIGVYMSYKQPPVGVVTMRSGDVSWSFLDNAEIEIDCGGVFGVLKETGLFIHSSLLEPDERLMPIPRQTEARSTITQEDIQAFVIGVEVGAIALNKNFVDAEAEVQKALNIYSARQGLFLEYP